MNENKQEEQKEVELASWSSPDEVMASLGI